MHTMIDRLFVFLPWACLALLVAAWSAAAFALLALRSAPDRRTRWTGRVVPALVAAAAASVAFLAVVIPPRLTGRDLGLAEIVVVPDVSAITDRGQSIPVRRYAGQDTPARVPHGHEGRAILAGGDRALSNCHGWVFTGGRYAIAGENVDAILADNGYQRVEKPEIHDLVVYRDAAGHPVHTGIIKAVGADGFVLVESKWGALQVFWHTPDQQGYSPRWDYWHSDRRGHLLSIARRTSAARRGSLPAHG